MEKKAAIARRLRLLRRALKKAKLSALLFTNPITRQYLSGFTGTAGTLLVTEERALLYTDFRYTERALDEVPSCITVSEVSRELKKVISAELKRLLSKRIGFEDATTSVAEFETLRRLFRSSIFVPVKEMVTTLRSIKDDAEVEDLKRAIAITDAVFAKTVRWLKRAKRSNHLLTEEAVSDFIRHSVHEEHGAELSFPSIVASGPNAARPHHEPTNRRLKKGESMVIDIGAKINGYHADMSRTIFLGAPSATLEHMYATTLRAQQRAYRYLRAGGRSAEKADAVSRDYINIHYPGAFGHSLGHGVGLEIHEAPTLGPKSKHRLRSGMVFSLEPGIYVPNVGGVRIEDLACTDGASCRYLSKSPKSLKDSIL